MKAMTYSRGWVNCPVCGDMIVCIKSKADFIMTGHGTIKPVLPYTGKMVYRPKNCTKCGELYKISNTQFYGNDYTVCPAGVMMVLGEVAL
jgi:predicted RNA-binding Zn-ribbon protein involved in translation (DUF1610 family)